MPTYRFSEKFVNDHIKHYLDITSDDKGSAIPVFNYAEVVINPFNRDKAMALGAAMLHALEEKARDPSVSRVTGAMMMMVGVSHQWFERIPEGVKLDGPLAKLDPDGSHHVYVRDYGFMKPDENVKVIMGDMGNNPFSTEGPKKGDTIN